MPARFDSIGLRFDYPENWTVESQDQPRGAQAVVSSPETAYWHVARYEPSAELETLFDEALAALRAEYRDMEVASVHERIDDVPVEGYDVNFYLFDFTNTAWVRGVKTPGATYLVVCQAEDRELETAGPVFRAMLASLLRGAGSP